MSYIIFLGSWHPETVEMHAKNWHKPTKPLMLNSCCYLHVKYHYFFDTVMNPFCQKSFHWKRQNNFDLTRWREDLFKTRTDTKFRKFSRDYIHWLCNHDLCVCTIKKKWEDNWTRLFWIMYSNTFVLLAAMLPLTVRIFGYNDVVLTKWYFISLNWRVYL